MYLLDTNVVSELRKVETGSADPRVKTWAESSETESSFLSAITILELEQGVLLMERRDARQGLMLRSWLEKHVLADFAGRILPVDIAVARRCAALNVPNPKPYRDGLIAATALVHGLTVVTRNTSDFKSTGVALLNPWQS
jgi:predicted nucleic acid-binding protein